MLDLLDKDLGAKIRAGIAVVLALATAVLGLCQAVLDILNQLPDWQYVGGIAMFVQGALSLVGRFASFGNKVAEAVD